MNELIRRLITVSLILTSFCANAQEKPKIIVSFDLDKYLVGPLPFDKRFEFSAFDTKYDEILFSYSLDENYNDNPRYNSGAAQIALIIDKISGKARFPNKIGPLHPNVPYDFKFQVSKEITLTSKEEEALRSDIFKLVEEDFKDVKKIDSGKINDFKSNLQALLTKYAKTDQILQRNGEPLDVTKTPLFTTELHPILSKIELNYYTINSDYLSNGSDNQISNSKTAALKALFSSEKDEAIFRSLSSVLFNNRSISNSFKGVLDSPINPISGNNEKLTLRQYLEFILEEPESKISDVINGLVKINGNDHIKANGPDISSIKLLSNIIEKLTRKSIRKGNGDDFFNTNEVDFLRLAKIKVDAYLDKLSDYKFRLQEIKKSKNEIPNILRNTIAKKDIKISEEVVIDVFAEKNAYIGLDAGLGFAFGKANGLFTYQGANFYFRPVNHQTPFSDLEGADEFWKRFSLYVGIAQVITIEEDDYEPLVGDSSVLIGTGFRLNRGFRLNIGGLLHYKKDVNPIIDNKTITVSPTLSLSVDINLVKAIGVVGTALNL